MAQQQPLGFIGRLAQLLQLQHEVQGPQLQQQELQDRQSHDTMQSVLAALGLTQNAQEHQGQLAELIRQHDLENTQSQAHIGQLSDQLAAERESHANDVTYHQNLLGQSQAQLEEEKRLHDLTATEAENRLGQQQTQFDEGRKSDLFRTLTGLITHPDSQNASFAFLKPIATQLGPDYESAFNTLLDQRTKQQVANQLPLVQGFIKSGNQPALDQLKTTLPNEVWKGLTPYLPNPEGKLPPSAAPGLNINDLAKPNVNDDGSTNFSYFQ